MTKPNLALVVAATLLSCPFLSPRASAQKGTGGETGIARQAVLPEIVTLRGKVTAVNSHPCEKTTGRAPIGTHVLVETRAGTELNIHLGPVDAVKDIADRLEPGRKITIDAFRTDAMSENHYVARTIHLGKTTFAVRDDRLRPLWSGPAGKWGNFRGKGPGPNWGRRGSGRGYGFCGGYGTGRGSGPCWRREW